MGVCFLQLFDSSTPKASNCDPTTSEYFAHSIFMILALKIKISGKKLFGHNLSGCLTILAFKISKKLNYGLKKGILKMFSKNCVSSTHTATLEI